jgi:lipoate-protein ligase A
MSKKRKSIISRLLKPEGPRLLPKFTPTPKSGTISTIDSPAKRFVDIRTRIKKIGGYAMGGEAGESLRKGTLFKKKRDMRRKEVDEMLERLYGSKPKIVPKKKPKRNK